MNLAVKQELWGWRSGAQKFSGQDVNDTCTLLFSWSSSHIRWGQAFRLRHLSTGHYLALTEDRGLVLQDRERSDTSATAFCFRPSKVSVSPIPKIQNWICLIYFYDHLLAPREELLPLGESNPQHWWCLRPTYLIIGELRMSHGGFFTGDMQGIAHWLCVCVCVCAVTSWPFMQLLSRQHCKCWTGAFVLSAWV